MGRVPSDRSGGGLGGFHRVVRPTALAASHLQGPRTTVVHVWTTSLLWWSQCTNDRAGRTRVSAGSGEQALAQVAVGRGRRPGGRRRSRRPRGGCTPRAARRPGAPGCAGTATCRRWNDTNARPWSSWPAPSKPREKLSPAPEDEVVLGLGRAGVGQADVGVERGGLAVGVGGEVGDVGLDLAVERGAVVLAPADQGLLLGRGGCGPRTRRTCG